MFDWGGNHFIRSHLSQGTMSKNKYQCCFQVTLTAIPTSLLGGQYSVGVFMSCIGTAWSSEYFARVWRYIFTTDHILIINKQAKIRGVYQIPFHPSIKYYLDHNFFISCTPWPWWIGTLKYLEIDIEDGKTGPNGAKQGQTGPNSTKHVS